MIQAPTCSLYGSSTPAASEQATGFEECNGMYIKLDYRISILGSILGHHIFANSQMLAGSASGGSAGEAKPWRVHVEP